uniref:Uncharacterized protein n=1 Tax=Denticeps clupeoides TaxID=299321 RepID=A0AAY4DQ30_9TELE
MTHKSASQYVKTSALLCSLQLAWDLDANSFSHSTSTTLYKSMLALASSTEEWPALLTWISLPKMAFPAFLFSSGMREVSRVKLSLWRACPTSTLPDRILTICNEDIVVGTLLALLCTRPRIPELESSVLESCQRSQCNPPMLNTH